MAIDFVDELAHLWVEAERKDNPQAFAGMTDEEARAIGRDRAIAVSEGEIKRSEMLAGDKAVWRYRPRAREIAGGDALDIVGFEGCQWWNFFDTTQTKTASFSPVTQNDEEWNCSSEYVFSGNKNIGNGFHTNLQVGGQLGYEKDFIVDQFYVTPVVAFAFAPWDAVAVLVVNSRLVTPHLPLTEIYRGVFPVNLTVRSRENVQVRVAYRDPPRGRQMRFHLEGLLTPPQAMLKPRRRQ